MTLILIVRLVSLFVLLWFGSVNATKFFRRHPISGTNFAIMSAAAVGFIWSMGWLS